MTNNNASSSQAAASVSIQSASVISTSVNHPRLLRTDAESIRIFLRLYDQYKDEVSARALQLTDNGSSTEAVRPVNLKFCVDADWLESAVTLGFINDAESVDEVTDSILREYLDTKAEASKDTVTVDSIDALVDKELKMDMSDRSATSRMEALFAMYTTMLRRNGLSWICKDNQKMAVYHIMGAVKPKSLHDRLESDLNLAYYHLRKDFRGFLRHAVKLSDALELLDNGPPTNRNGKPNNNQTKNTSPSRGGSNNQSPSDTVQSSSDTKKPKFVPKCPFPVCKKKGLKHWIDDCTTSDDKQKATMKADIIAAKARDGPSKSTRGQKAQASDKDSASGTTGRLNKETPISVKGSKTNCELRISDGLACIEATGRCDDGSDDSLVSPTLAERAALRGIGKLDKIPPTRLQVALKKGPKAHTFSFSRTWTAPRTVLQLPSGQLALMNIKFLVADDELACEELLIGRPVLEHLKVDTNTLLDTNRSVLDGVDCSEIGNPTAAKNGGMVSRIMVSRLNQVQEDEPNSEVQGELAADRPRVNYNAARNEEDPFPDPSLLDPIDSMQHKEVETETEEMLHKAKENGLSTDHSEKMRYLVQSHKNIFRTAFSSGPPADLRPLRIDLTPEARPVKVRLRNYSKEQRNFLDDQMSKLIRAGMVYLNPTSKWACAPLLVPKPGPAKFRFTVDLRPVNKYTERHQFPLPHIEQELSKLSGSRFYAIFDLSHGYWQLPLSEDSQECQSIITPDGIFSPTRVLHGSTNAVTHMRSAMQEVMPTDLAQQLLYWVDDFLLHASSVSDLIRYLEKFFKVCAERNIKLQPAKCTLFTQTVRWCGRLITPDGIRFDPARLEGLLNMESPSNGAHLQQLLCALQWVKLGIPNFTDIVSPLHELMEEVYSRSGKRTTRAVSRLQLSDIGWSDSHESAFSDCKKALAHQVTLRHHDESLRLSVYTDASDTVWSGMITQVPWEDLGKPQADQRHGPLAFLSGRFNQTQLRWSVLEKEAYAALATLARMHWLVSTPSGFDLYTDHNNLIFLFDPLSVVPDLAQTSIRKVLRWAVRLSVYSYTCIHIRGSENV